MLSEQDLKNREVGFYEGCRVENNVATLIRQNALRKPEAIAMEWQGQNGPGQVTFREFYELSAKTARGLKKYGIQKGDCVILFLPMSLELYQAMAAIMMVGAKAVFLDSWARRDQLGVSAEIVQPAGMISFEGAFALCAGVPELDRIPIRIVHAREKGPFTARLADLALEPALTDAEPVTGEDTALITFTTGSSGRPKGADRTHRFLSSQHLALDQTIPYRETDIDLPAFPIFSLNNLAAGVRTVIPAIDIGRPSEEDSRILADQIQSARVTCATLSPSMVTNLAKYCADRKIILPGLRRVITGGAPLSNDTLRLFSGCVPQAEVWVLYGSTEVEPIAHIELREILNQGETPGGGVNVGQIVEELEYRLIRINKAPVELPPSGWKTLEVGADEPGELVVAGLHVCKSYYNDPEAVRRAKIIEPDGKTWHRTGDIARFDARGNVVLVGRVHNAIVRNSKLLFPVQAEIVMKRHPRVRQAAYLGMPDPVLGEKAWALVTLDPEGQAQEEATLEEIAGLLQDQEIIFDHLAAAAEIPMDPRHHSKVEYEALRKKLLEAGGL